MVSVGKGGSGENAPRTSKGNFKGLGRRAFHAPITHPADFNGITEGNILPREPLGVVYSSHKHKVMQKSEEL
jgi:hypothetical protein